LNCKRTTREQKIENGNKRGIRNNDEIDFKWKWKFLYIEWISCWWITMKYRLHRLIRTLVEYKRIFMGKSTHKFINWRLKEWRNWGSTSYDVQHLWKLKVTRFLDYSYDESIWWTTDRWTDKWTVRWTSGQKDEQNPDTRNLSVLKIVL